MRSPETDGAPRCERVTLRAPTALLHRLDAVADRRHGGNRSAAARAALAAYADEHAPEAPVVGEWPTADGHVVVGSAVREVESGARR